MPTYTDLSDDRYEEFDAQITMLSTKSLGLNKSPFTPPADGQPTDKGYIGDIFVNQVQLGCDDALLHHHHDLAKVAKLSVGESVRCKIDRTLKFQNLRFHTARHLVEMALRRTHICGRSNQPQSGPVFSTLDIEVDLVTSPLDLQAVRSWVAGVIGDDLAITPVESHSGQTTRHWRLEGLGRIASAGKFLDSTAKVGGVSIAAEVEQSRVKLKIDLQNSGSDVKILPCFPASK